MGHSEDDAVYKIPHKIKTHWQNQLKISELVFNLRSSIELDIHVKRIDFILVQCSFKGGFGFLNKICHLVSEAFFFFFLFF